MTLLRHIATFAVIGAIMLIASSAPVTDARASRRAATRTPPTRVVIGHSVQGRPIVAWEFGRASARRKILVVGCIHGNECAGLAITAALRRQQVPNGVQLWLVPEMNPDGTAADTRQNAHGVDLNRNFPYRWQAISDPTYYSGPAPSPSPRLRPRSGWSGGSGRR
ncbi:MAG: DUF2817 domain-containing protein [Solirubrobacterales bacterium]|nr:DUF2817 domain-containing protein [Solirubrobacterales bacterium]